MGLYAFVQHLQGLSLTLDSDSSHFLTDFASTYPLEVRLQTQHSGIHYTWTWLLAILLRMEQMLPSHERRI
jgi:hypothetical protein